MILKFLTHPWTMQSFIFLLILMGFLLIYSTRKFTYWKRKGVFNPQPIPLLGNMSDIFLMRKNVVQWICSLYDSTDAPFLGFFAFDEPYLMLRCPKLIQRVFIQDFSYFADRNMASPSHDVIMNNFTFFQNNPKWKTSRSKLTPAFSSGKIKRMFHLVNDVSKDMAQYLQKNLGNIDAKEVTVKYSVSVIAKCVFGIDALCFENKNSQFHQYATRLFDFTWRNTIAYIVYCFKPRWVDIFRINFFNQDSTRYFLNAFSKTLQMRKMSTVRTGDFVDILSDLNESENKEVHGHAMMFFAAGFETTSNTISYTLHELCLNKYIQNKLRKEIMDNIEEYGGITYEGVQEMKYLKMCINETLRKYPVLPFLERICTEDYKVPGTDLVIDKGIPVYIPYPALHKDERYFPHPQKYIPERFINKNLNISGVFYMPFGEGPRNCLGERFGILSTQLALINIISQFEVEKCAETPDPVEFSLKSFSNQSKVGLPMIIKPNDGYGR